MRIMLWWLRCGFEQGYHSTKTKFQTHVIYLCSSEYLILFNLICLSTKCPNIVSWRWYHSGYIKKSVTINVTHEGDTSVILMNKVCFSHWCLFVETEQLIPQNNAFRRQKTFVANHGIRPLALCENQKKWALAYFKYRGTDSTPIKF